MTTKQKFLSTVSGRVRSCDVGYLDLLQNWLFHEQVVLRGNYVAYKWTFWLTKDVFLRVEVINLVKQVFDSLELRVLLLAEKLYQQVDLSHR